MKKILADTLSTMSIYLKIARDAAMFSKSIAENELQKVGYKLATLTKTIKRAETI